MFLLDSQQNILAKITVTEINGNLYIGDITDDDLPDNIRETFLRYEEIINGQMFSLLDEIETQIDSLGLAVSEEDNLKPLKIRDLQMMSDGKISFRMPETKLTVEQPTINKNDSYELIGKLAFALSSQYLKINLTTLNAFLEEKGLSYGNKKGLAAGVSASYNYWKNKGYDVVASAITLTYSDKNGPASNG
jgi:hypothetical protein